MPSPLLMPVTLVAAAVFELLHYAKGSFSSPVIMTLLSNIMEVDNPTFNRLLEKFLRTHLDFVGFLLESGNCIIGDEFTEVDAQLKFILQMAVGQGFLDSRLRLREYVAHMEGRPIYQRALKKGGPFDVSFGK